MSFEREGITVRSRDGMRLQNSRHKLLQRPTQTVRKVAKTLRVLWLDEGSTFAQHVWLFLLPAMLGLLYGVCVILMETGVIVGARDQD